MVKSCLPARLRNVEVLRKGQRVLGPLNWTLAGEGITVLMGPNGSGKTTLLRSMHGLERLSGGSIVWAGSAEGARRAQAFVFQTPILMRRSVIDCIAYPLRLDGWSRKSARARAAELAAEVGLGKSGDRPSESLSGGEKQKMALARALTRDPQVLYLDEPCSNLDGSSTHAIELILKHASETGTRIVISTHDIGQARRIADEIVFLHHGRIMDALSHSDFFGGRTSAEADAYLKGRLLP